MIRENHDVPLKPLFNNKIYFDNNYLKKDCDDELVRVIKPDLAI